MPTRPARTLADEDLERVVTRRELTLPPKATRVGVRSLSLYLEVHERFKDGDPSSHDAVRKWMQGLNDKKGCPSGKEFASNLATILGIHEDHIMQRMHIDHMFPQADMPGGWKGKLANLVLLESEFNLTSEFKERNSVKKAFFGSSCYNMNRRWLRWQMSHPNSSSLEFFKSTDNVDNLQPIYASSSRSQLTSALEDTSLAVVDAASSGCEENKDKSVAVGARFMRKASSSSTRGTGDPSSDVPASLQSLAITEVKSEVSGCMSSPDASDSRCPFT